MRILDDILARRAGGTELRAEDQRRENPADKNVNDVNPNWAPPSFIGTSWSLIETRQEGIFLSGVLVNPRGNALPGRVFVIASEWDCG